MNNGRFATTPTPQYFHGEDVIGEELYPNYQQQQVNRIPQSIQQKVGQYQPQAEEIYQQPVAINANLQVDEQSIIVKNLKINLEINLKINVV